MYNKYFKHEKGITGLETAIILIAFVVVAAVFAYTALSAGLFSTQKAQEAVYSGLTEARSTLELKGAVVATENASTNTVGHIIFTVSNVLGGEPVDFTEPQSCTSNGTANGTINKVVINYLDASQEVDNLFWSYEPVGTDDDDGMLEAGEKFQITVGGEYDLTSALEPDLGPNDTFRLVVLTPAGAVLNIERTMPAFLDPVVNLR